eukprot:1158392-Pelagomonas_calceolata.AAC.1
MALDERSSAALHPRELRYIIQHVRADCQDTVLLSSCEMEHAEQKANTHGNILNLLLCPFYVPKPSHDMECAEQWANKNVKLLISVLCLLLCQSPDMRMRVQRVNKRGKLLSFMLCLLACQSPHMRMCGVDQRAN